MLITANGNVDVKIGVSFNTYPFYTACEMSYFVFFNARIIGLLWILKRKQIAVLEILNMQKRKENM